MRWAWAAAVALTTAACSGRWPASMEDHPGGDLQGSVRRRPPAMAIPVGGIEIVEHRQELEDLPNPYKADPQLVELGTRLFADFCVPCHGPEGRGMGKLAERFPPAPDLRHISICDRSDGFLYGTLTSGGRAMPTMREGLTSRQRWALVAFVRKLQTEGCTGSRADIVSEERR